MLKLLRNLRRQEWAMAAVCAVLILGQIYFDLALPDYMSSLTVLIKTPGSTLSDILHTGLEMLGCTLASAVLCVICGYLTAKVAAGFSFSIREAVFHKIADFGQQEMMTFSVPSLINRTTNDITQVQMLTAMGLQILIKSPVMAVWAIIKIVGKSWTLSAITAGFVAALLVMMAVIIGVVVPQTEPGDRLMFQNSFYSEVLGSIEYHARQQGYHILISATDANESYLTLAKQRNLDGIIVIGMYPSEFYQQMKKSQIPDRADRQLLQRLFTITTSASTTPTAAIWPPSMCCSAATGKQPFSPGASRRTA